MKERQALYRQELENQRKEIQTRINMSKNMDSQKDKESLQKQLNFMKETADGDYLKEKQKKALAINIMDENVKLKRKVLEEAKEKEQRETLAVMERLKRIEEEEKAKIEAEKQNRIKLANALKESYNVQEDIRRQQREKLKELDKVYSEKHKERLMEEEKYRQRVIFSKAKKIVLRCVERQAGEKQ
eukprot:TRINITY_DN135387_c1_g1_i1.p4 TRINITY_DN135387_c1_g1~~TRINITY_DN135387_c1_g1_i1.p4  ORF type:complete len:186 (-),score=57.72 TRINITY_DN135387_c1_g1_i1:1216-1773(-)